MSTLFLVEETRFFLDHLTPPRDHWLEIRTVRPDERSVQQTFCASVDEALQCVEQYSGKANVYVGACPRSERRGTRDAVRFVIATWADLDFHQLDADDRGHAEAVGYERISSLGIQPSILVRTGNGLQAWWHFHEPILISAQHPASYFESINRGIAKKLGGDAVHDLARVLRIPGTVNLPDAKKRARGCVPVMARLVHSDGPTWSPDDFAHLEVKVSKITSAHRDKPVAIVESPHPHQEVLEAFEKLLLDLGSSHPLARTWRGDRVLKDSSRSGWDWALVNQLVCAGIRDEFIPVIVRAFRFGRGVFATDDYLQRTMAKAMSKSRGKDGTSRTAC